MGRGMLFHIGAAHAQVALRSVAPEAYASTTLLTLRGMFSNPTESGDLEGPGGGVVGDQWTFDVGGGKAH